MDTTCRCARRTVLRRAALGAAGASTLALTACGSDDTGSAGGSSEESSGEAAWRTALGTEEVPAVGESVSASVGDQDLLLHRTAEDEILAYTSVCTHQGCTVEPQGEEFACPCHGSTFAAADGSVVSGPARSPLAEFSARFTEDGAVEVQV